MPTKKSTVISIRLNPANQEDLDVIKILEEQKKRGRNIRHIVTHAILAWNGNTPEMYHDSNDTVTRHVIESLLSDFAQEIIETLRQTSAQQSQQTKTQDDGDEDEQYARNLAEGFMSRRKRGQSK